MLWPELNKLGVPCDRNSGIHIPKICGPEKSVPFRDRMMKVRSTSGFESRQRTNNVAGMCWRRSSLNSSCFYAQYMYIYVLLKGKYVSTNASSQEGICSMELVAVIN